MAIKSIPEQISDLKKRLCILEAKNTPSDTNLATTNLLATDNRQHDWANKDLVFKNLKNLFLESSGIGEVKLSHKGSTTDAKDNYAIVNANIVSLRHYSVNDNKVGAITVKTGGIVELFSTSGIYELPNLTKAATQNRIIGQTSLTGRLGFITIGDNLSLVDGVLSATGGGGGGTPDTNFATTNLVATGSRTHSWANNALTISDISTLSLIGTGNFSFITNAGVALIQGSTFARLYVAGKGIEINGVGDLKLGNYLSTRNDAATSKALYVDIDGNVKYGPISGGGGGGGEANTASNVGATGLSWFKAKSGVDLEFRKFIVGTGLTAGQNTNDITIENSAPDQVVSLTPGNANIGITGTYPNFTITATGVNKDAFTLAVNGTRTANSGETIIAFFVLPSANLTGFKVGTTDGGEELVVLQDIVADGEWKSFGINYKLASNKTFYIKGITSSTQFEIVKI